MFVSAAEKFGVDVLLDDEPLAEDGSEDDEEEDDGVEEEDDGLLVVPLELLPETDGVDDDDEDGLVDGLLDEDEDCATASVDSAKRTAAVVMLRVFGMDLASSGERNGETLRASAVPQPANGLSAWSRNRLTAARYHPAPTCPSR